MNEILKKIDERINELDVCLKGPNEIHERHCLRMMLGEVREMKEIILSQHKQLATDNNVVTKSGKDNNVLTIGDKIRESNESLTEYIIKLLKENEEYHHSLDAQEWNTYLNQPYTDTIN